MKGQKYFMITRTYENIHEKYTEHYFRGLYIFLINNNSNYSRILTGTPAARVRFLLEVEIFPTVNGDAIAQIL